MSDRNTYAEKALATIANAEKAGLTTERGQQLVAAAHAYAAIAALMSPNPIGLNVMPPAQSPDDVARSVADRLRVQQVSR